MYCLTEYIHYLCEAIKGKAKIDVLNYFEKSLLILNKKFAETKNSVIFVKQMSKTSKV